jgi:hypothetical protein
LRPHAACAGIADGLKRLEPILEVVGLNMTVILEDLDDGTEVLRAVRPLQLRHLGDEP